MLEQYVECVVLSARRVCPNPPNPTWIHPLPLYGAFEPWWLVLTIDDIDNVLTHVHTNNSLKWRSIWKHYGCRGRTCRAPQTHGTENTVETEVWYTIIISLAFNLLIVDAWLSNKTASKYKWVLAVTLLCTNKLRTNLNFIGVLKVVFEY